MRNRTFTNHIGIDWIVAIILFSIAVALLILYLILSESHSLFFFLIFILAPVLQFLITPLFRVSGIYAYLSPMLLAVSSKKNQYELHNGTSFDYLLHMRRQKPGISWQNRLLYFYITGLLEIIRRVEDHEIKPDIIIKGSSYFFSDKSARRLGFETNNTKGFTAINIIINYLDLTWMYSCSKGKLAFPSLKNIKTAVTTGKELCLQKEYLIKLQERLNKYGN